MDLAVVDVILQIAAEAAPQVTPKAVTPDENPYIVEHVAHHLEARQFNFNSFISEASSAVVSIFSPPKATAAASSKGPKATAAATTAGPSSPQTTGADGGDGSSPTTTAAVVPIGGTAATTKGPAVVTTVPISSPTTTPSTTAVPTMATSGLGSSLSASQSATTTVSAAADSNGNKSSDSGGGSSAHTLPIALGVSFGVGGLALAGLALLFCLRRRRRNAAAAAGQSGSDNESILEIAPSSTMSENRRDVHYGGLRGIGGLGAGAVAGAATAGGIGAAENIARRSRQNLTPPRSTESGGDYEYSRDSLDGPPATTSPTRSRGPATTAGYVGIPPPHQLSGGDRRHSADYAYVPSGDPFEDGRRSLHSGPGGGGSSSSRLSLSLAAVSEEQHGAHEEMGGLAPYAAAGAMRPRRASRPGQYGDNGGSMPGSRPGPGGGFGPGPGPPGPRGGPYRGGPPSSGNLPASLMAGGGGMRPPPGRRGPPPGAPNGNGRRPSYGPGPMRPPPNGYNNGQHQYGPGPYGPGPEGPGSYSSGPSSGPSSPPYSSDMPVSPPMGGMFSSTTSLGSQTLMNRSQASLSTAGNGGGIRRKPVGGGGGGEEPTSPVSPVELAGAPVSNAPKAGDPFNFGFQGHGGGLPPANGTGSGSATPTRFYRPEL